MGPSRRRPDVTRLGLLVLHPTQRHGTTESQRWHAGMYTRYRVRQSVQAAAICFGSPEFGLGLEDVQVLVGVHKHHRVGTLNHPPHFRSLAKPLELAHNGTLNHTSGFPLPTGWHHAPSWLLAGVMGFTDSILPHLEWIYSSESPKEQSPHTCHHLIERKVDWRQAPVLRRIGCPESGDLLCDVLGLTSSRKLASFWRFSGKLRSHSC